MNLLKGHLNEEPGAGNLLARICGGAGEATPQLYPDIHCRTRDSGPGAFVSRREVLVEAVKEF